MISDLHTTFYNATILVTIPVLVATIVWLKHQDTIFEATILCDLVTMQILATLGATVSGLLFINSEEKTNKAKRPPDKCEIWISIRRKPIWITSSTIISFALYIQCLKVIRGSLPDASLFGELTSACHVYGVIVPNIPWDLSSLTTHSQLPSDYTEASGRVGGYMIITIIAIILYGIILFLCYFILSNYAFVNAICTIGLSWAAWHYVSRIQTMRNVLRESSSFEFVDDQWGFGQVLSLFVWLPAVWTLVSLVLTASQIWHLSGVANQADDV